MDLLEFDDEEDHIHLLIETHSNTTPSKFINSFKTVTSRHILKEFSQHISKYYCKPLLWTRAYCILSVGGAPIDTLKSYIEKQTILK
ncbi:IS200/IS605 family transposase [Candidatus Babeliales bacterium]|nr:IS200/IS605 family transposase [Candidatus Babeliales bacterium]